MINESLLYRSSNQWTIWRPLTVSICYLWSFPWVCKLKTKRERILGSYYLRVLEDLWWLTILTNASEIVGAISCLTKSFPLRYLILFSVSKDVIKWGIAWLDLQISSAWQRNSPKVIESLNKVLIYSFLVASLIDFVGTLRLTMYGMAIGYSLHKYFIISNKNSNFGLELFCDVWIDLISSII